MWQRLVDDEFLDRSVALAAKAFVSAFPAIIVVASFMPESVRHSITSTIAHRLGVAGGLTSIRFDPAAAMAIGELSRGLPRRVNVLCDRALQEGRIEGVNVITPDLVKRAAQLAGV